MIAAKKYAAFKSATHNNDYLIIDFLISKDNTLLEKLSPVQKDQLNKRRYHSSSTHHILHRVIAVSDITQKIFSLSELHPFFKPAPIIEEKYHNNYNLLRISSSLK